MSQHGTRTHERRRPTITQPVTSKQARPALAPQEPAIQSQEPPPRFLARRRTVQHILEAAASTGRDTRPDHTSGHPPRTDARTSRKANRQAANESKEED